MDKNRVQEFREANLWSKAELGRRADLNENTISNMEKFKKTNRNSKLKVSKALDKDVEVVFTNPY